MIGNESTPLSTIYTYVSHIFMDFHNCDPNLRLTKNVESVILYHEKKDRGVGVLEGELFVVKRILVFMCLNSQVQGSLGIVLHRSPEMLILDTVLHVFS